MSLPLGTTSRQIGVILRWMYVGIIVVGMLAWWYPGYRNWGAMLGALLVCQCLWFMFRIVSEDRRIWGNPFYVVLLWPGLMLIFHWFSDSLGKDPQGGFWGGFDMSLLFGLAVLAIVVLLSQSLMAQMSHRHVSVISFAGGAMMLGGVQGVFIPQAGSVSGAMGLVGLAGAAVWLGALWMKSSVDNEPVIIYDRRGGLEISCIVVAVLMIAAFVIAMNKTALMAGLAAVGFVWLIAGLIFKRNIITICGAVGLVAGGLFLKPWRLFSLLGGMTRADWAGGGENALAKVTANSWSISYLGSIAGWAVVLLMILFAMWAVFDLLRRSARSSKDDQNRALAWASASGLATVALFAPGGLFIPAVILAAGLCWGTIPSMSARGSKSRSGLYLLIIMITVAVLLGVTRSVGLLIWVVDAAVITDKPDKFLHFIMGLLLAMGLAWQMGTKRMWLGLLAIGLSMLAGGAGELLQRAIGTRQEEQADWIAHIIGSAVAIIPYILCVGARLCEFADVELTTFDEHKYEDRYIE